MFAPKTTKPEAGNKYYNTLSAMAAGISALMNFALCMLNDDYY